METRTIRAGMSVGRTERMLPDFRMLQIHPPQQPVVILPYSERIRNRLRKAEEQRWKDRQDAAREARDRELWEEWRKLVRGRI